ncbi:MAG: HD domain-containing protein [Planctomycetes bacterium]|nr:HD domain-containing protein [Planctomycetota bacterium]
MDYAEKQGVSLKESANHDIALDQANTAAATGYLPVDPNMMQPGENRRFDLYQRSGEEMVLFCDKDYRLTREDLQRVSGGRGSALHVPTDQGPALSTYVEKVLWRVVRNEKVTMARRAGILHAAARTIMSDILAHPTAEGVLRRGTVVANATVDLMTQDQGALKSMVSLFTKDYYTYTHCVHTCVLGVAMYKYLVSPKIEALRRLGLGLLLHDTGKSVVKKDVLNKRGRLTENEFEHMKLHAAAGWEILRRHGVNDDMIRQVVLHHHERLDGSGYPDGLSRDQISKESRVAGIVDVYDALTTDRPYRTAMTHVAAVTLMRNTMVPNGLDPEYFYAFQKVSQSLAE